MLEKLTNAEERTSAALKDTMRSVFHSFGEQLVMCPVFATLVARERTTEECKEIGRKERWPRLHCGLTPCQAGNFLYLD